MVRTRFFCIFALCAVALAPEALAQQFTAKPYADVGGWKVSAYLAEGQHMNCEVSPPGGPGAAFGRSREGWTLLVRAKTKGDAEIPGVVDIDGKSFKSAFSPFEGDKLGVFLKPANLKAIQAGKSMTVRVGGETTSAPLEGVAAALRKAKECDDKGQAG